MALRTAGRLVLTAPNPPRLLGWNLLQIPTWISGFDWRIRGAIGRNSRDRALGTILEQLLGARILGGLQGPPGEPTRIFELPWRIRETTGETIEMVDDRTSSKPFMVFLVPKISWGALSCLKRNLCLSISRCSRSTRCSKTLRTSTSSLGRRICTPPLPIRTPLAATM